MVSDEQATNEPGLVYDKESGLIVLTDGECRQVIARPEGMHLHLFWKRQKREVKVSLDHLVALIVQAGE